MQYLADKDLGKKGLTRKTDRADLVVWLNYEAEYSQPFQLRILTLNIARAENKEIIWRGTATGAIKSDAASKDLEKVIAGFSRISPPNKEPKIEVYNA